MIGIINLSHKSIMGNQRYHPLCHVWSLLTVDPVYSYATVGFWGLVVLFGTLNNILRHLNSSSAFRSAFTTKLQGFILRYLAVPPIMKSKQMTRFSGFSTTPRLCAITISTFFLINIVLMCVEYHAFETNLYFTQKSTQLWRYIGDRAGVMAINNLPVMWLFATRNNFLLWATGWEFATFNMFHRWIARACGLEVFVHGMCVCIYQNLELGTEYFLPIWKETHWFTGVIAASSIILSCLLASSGIRNAVYDLFLIVHQGFACLILVGLWYHLMVDGPDYVVFIWPCVAVWSFDRLGRILRLLIWNKVTAYSSAEYNSEANVILIKARVRQALSLSPGTHFYVYGWRSIKFWESHPFTLSGWNKVTTGEEFYTELIFLVSIRDGFTSRLRRQLLHHGDSESELAASSAVRKVTLSVEGPYGTSFYPWKSENAIFIIGGAGITVATSFMQQLLDSLRSDEYLKSGIKTIKIVWAVRNVGLYQFVRERYISTWENVLASKDVELSLDIYLTSSSKSNDEISTPTEHISQPFEPSGDTKSDSSPPSSVKAEILTKNVLCQAESEKSGDGALKTTFYHGRPRISDIVTSHVGALDSSGGKNLALVGCGPKAMAHDIRLAFDDVSKIPDVNVDFHLAPFGW
ncbi:hypothetical protein N7455_008193 [Penicillium solitum]|uniref:uncharacterized protein n=1 Tax=Penicillium solitum TaxID=60172 RepID=UPI0032C46ADA|nr:hypothetical protein N7455_008193 [Penicillium solitum]